jgi:hypothetical protein
LAVLDDERFTDRELATARDALNESALAIRVDLVRWSQPPQPQPQRSVIGQTGARFNSPQMQTPRQNQVRAH